MSRTQAKQANYILAQLRDDWAEIDNYAMSHLHPSSRGDNAAISVVLDKTLVAGKEAGMLPGNVSPAWDKFLTIQTRTINARHTLEVGILAGFSAIWLATQVPGLRLDTVEYSARHAEVAQKNIEAAKVADRVTIHQGTGLVVLKTLEKEVADGRRGRFDFTFIDADEMNSASYFDFALRMCRPGSIIIVDNVMGRFGVKVSEPNPEEEHASGGKQVIEAVGKYDRADATVMQFVGAKGYDGYLVALVL